MEKGCAELLGFGWRLSVALLMPDWKHCYVQALLVWQCELCYKLTLAPNGTLWEACSAQNNHLQLGLLSAVQFGSMRCFAQVDGGYCAVKVGLQPQPDNAAFAAGDSHSSKAEVCWTVSASVG